MDKIKITKGTRGRAEYRLVRENDGMRGLIM